LSRLDRLPGRVPQPVGDDERIPRVLIEQGVRLDVQRVGEGVPDDLIDTDDSSGRVAALIERAAQADEKDGVAGDALDIDGPVEGNGGSGRKVEAVERVEGVDVFAVRPAFVAIRQRQIDPPCGVVARVWYREPVTGKRPARPRVQIEERMD